MTRVRIFVCMSMNKNLFLWAAKLPGSGHKNADSWNNSGIEAAEAAMKRKVRVQSNRAISAYEYFFSDDPADYSVDLPHWNHFRHLTFRHPDGRDRLTE